MSWDYTCQDCGDISHASYKFCETCGSDDWMYTPKKEESKSTRDITRIKPFINRLKILWLQNPDLRFGQIIDLLDRQIGGDTFYVEDDKWLDVIEHFTKPE